MIASWTRKQVRPGGESRRICIPQRLAFPLVSRNDVVWYRRASFAAVAGIPQHPSHHLTSHFNPLMRLPRLDPPMFDRLKVVGAACFCCCCFSNQEGIVSAPGM